MTMDSTTLVTFFVDCPAGTRSLDLFGSWDNFSSPYRMGKDGQIGNGRWRGCHQFKNIICDGDPSNISPARNGPLLTGGTYWYYYVRNGYQEVHDPSKTSTTLCPLLPGQTVNLLEIPHLQHSSLSNSESADVEFMTLNPDDRTLRPEYASKRKRATSRAASHHKLREKRRQTYLDNAAIRLHTSAADILITTFFGHRHPNRAQLLPRTKSAGDFFDRYQRLTLHHGSSMVGDTAISSDIQAPILPTEDLPEDHQSQSQPQSLGLPHINVERPPLPPNTSMCEPHLSLRIHTAPPHLSRNDSGYPICDDKVQCPKTAPPNLVASSNMYEVDESTFFDAPCTWNNENDNVKLRAACLGLGFNQAELSPLLLNRAEMPGKDTSINRCHQLTLSTHGDEEGGYFGVKDSIKEEDTSSQMVLLSPSVLWTPETSSPLSSGDFWGSPIVTSRRQSSIASSATTAYEDASIELIGSSFKQHKATSMTGLGICFTGTDFLASQETIKAPANRQVTKLQGSNNDGSGGERPAMLAQWTPPLSTTTDRFAKKHAPSASGASDILTDLSYLADAIL